MKKSISILCMGLSICSYSQSIGQQLIGVTGGYFEQTNLNLAMSMGEICVETTSTETSVLTQGFQQTIIHIATLSNEEIMNIDISLYPNPTKGSIYIKTGVEDMSYTVFSLDGKQLAQGKLIQEETQINLADYASGFYLIEVFSETQGIKETFKITKH